MYVIGKGEKMREKRKMRKLMVLLMVFTMAVSLVGCGSGSKGKNKMSQKDMKELVYRAQMLDSMDQISGDISSYAVKGDTLYIYTTEWIEGEGNNDIIPKTAETTEVIVEDTKEENVTEEAQTSEEASANEDDTAEEADENADAKEAGAAEETDENAQTDETDAAETKEDATDNEVTDAQDGATSDIAIEEQEYTYTTNQYFYKMKMDGSGVETIFEKLDCSDQSEWLNQFCIGSDDNIYMLYSSYNQTLEKSEFIIRILDLQGTQKNEFSLMDVFGEQDTYVQTMCMDEEDNLYLLTDQIVYVISPDGRELFNAKMDGWGSGMVVMNDGKIAVSTYGEEGMELKVVDKAAKDFGQTHKMTINSYGSNSFYAGKGEYSLFYNDNSNLCGYNVETGKSTQIMNWVSSNIGGSNINNIVALEDGKFLCSYYDTTMGDSAKNSLYLLEKVDPSEVADKTIITYAGLYVDDQVKNQAVRFNKEQDQYQIVVKDYSNSEDSLKDMNADLLAGDIPDIIDLANLNVDKYIAKGMLTDLYTFMENDPDIRKEDFQENILKLMETDGKLYRISPSFGINALVGRASDVGNLTKFTIDDLIALEQKYGKDVKAFNMTSNTGALMNICNGNYRSFIDWTTGKCNFDSDEFIKLLEYANTYPKDEDIDWDNYVSLPTMVREKKCIFGDVYSLSMEEVELYDKLFEEEIAFVGYPSETTVGPAVSLNSNIGIYAKTANPEGAWTFLKTFLSEEYICGKGQYFYGGFPLRKDAFEAEVKKYSTKTKYTDKYGNEISPVDSSWGYDDVEVKIEPLSDKQVEKVREVVAKADHLANYDSDIMNIITEEAGAYFSGQKSAKEVAGIIQNRVSTYVNENR